MTTTRRTHADCTHPSTSAARAACRKGSPNIPSTAAEARRRGFAAPATVDYSSMTYAFETETCSRCSGTGTYPSSAWQGVCLGCNGRGESLSRAGRAAKKAHDAWRIDHLTIPVADIVPGMKIKASPVDPYRTVTAVDEAHKNGTTTIGSGDNAVTTENWMITVHFGSNYGHSLMAEGTVLRAPTAEERNALIARIAKLKGTILLEKA